MLQVEPRSTIRYPGPEPEDQKVHDMGWTLSRDGIEAVYSKDGICGW